jgi:hypothetical protein
MTTNTKKVSIIFSVLLAGFFITMILIYGFLTVFYNEGAYSALGYSATELLDRALGRSTLLIMDTVFTLLGFGLLLSPYKNAKWSGLSIAVFVVSFNIILGLLFQDMFFEIFFGFRKDNNDVGDIGTVAAPTAYDFWNRHSRTKKATASFLSFRLSNLCSTAYLVGMTAFSGRIHIQKIAISLPIFCFFFYLNFYLNALVSYSDKNKDEIFSYFDAYGTIVVYLFGGLYGILVGALTKTPKTDEQTNRARKSRFSLLLSLLGAFFLFATFVTSFTSVITGRINSPQENFRLNAGAIHVSFGLAGGIIGNFAASLLAGKGKFSIQNVIIGIISGGIFVGGLADVIENIGVSTFLGFIAGIIAGLFLTLVTPKINSSSIVDEQGLLGPVLVTSFLASFVIHPSILSQYYIRRDSMNVRAIGGPETDNHVARYHLAYFAITLALGAVTGLLMGIIYRIKRNPNTDFEDTKFFDEDYGLYRYDLEVKKRSTIAPAGESQIKHQGSEERINTGNL